MGTMIAMLLGYTSGRVIGDNCIGLFTLGIVD